MIIFFISVFVYLGLAFFSSGYFNFLFKNQYVFENDLDRKSLSLLASIFFPFAFLVFNCLIPLWEFGFSFKEKQYNEKKLRIEIEQQKIRVQENETDDSLLIYDQEEDRELLEAFDQLESKEAEKRQNMLKLANKADQLLFPKDKSKHILAKTKRGVMPNH